MSDIEKFEPQTFTQDYGYQDYPYADSESEKSGPSFGQLFGSIMRRWYLIVLVLIIGCGIGVPAVWYNIKPTYFSEGAILVKPILTNIITGDPDKGEISNYQIYMNTQAELIKRDAILQRVEYALRDEQLSLFPPGSKPMSVLQSLFENETLLVSPEKNTNFLKIAMNHPEALVAEKVVNAFINSYMSVNMANEAKGGGEKINQLEQLKKGYKQDIERLQKQIKVLSKQYGMDDLTSRQELYLAKVEVLREKITGLEMEEIYLDSRVNFLNKVQSDTIPTSELISARKEYISADLELQNLIKDVTEEENALIRDQQLLTDTHPDLLLKKQIIAALKERVEQRRAEVTKEFNDEIASGKTTGQEQEIEKAQLQLDQTRHFLATYRDMLEQEEQDTKNVGLTQLDIQELKEKLKMDRESYNQVLKRIQEVELENKRPARMSIAYKANTIGPIDKRKKLIAAIGVGSLFAGFLLAFMLSKLDNSLRTPEDVIRCLDIPIIGTTTGMRQLDADAMPQQVSDDYQNIRANLGLFGDEGIPRILVVTSAGVREGKTTFSINLASSMAKGGSKVLLIDGDFRKPDIGHSLSLNGKAGGLQKVLFGSGKIEETVSRLPDVDLDVLTADPFNISGTFELLTRPATAKILREISKNYDHVVIDTAPLLAASDALLWSKMADAAVLVGFSGQTAGPELKEAYARLSRVNVRVLGTVLHSVHVDNSYHRYGYGYYGGGGKSKRRRRDQNRPLLLKDSSKNDKNS